MIIFHEKMEDIESENGKNIETKELLFFSLALTRFYISKAE